MKTIEMRVEGLALDPVNGTPIVLLRSVADKEKLVPIWIGQIEAIAIASELEKVRHPRPMTHDLLKNVILSLGYAVLRVEVVDLKDNTFYAAIHLEKDGQSIAVDSRPSDAIALAVRCDAPILVAEHVVEKARKGPETEVEEGEGAPTTQDKYEELLRSMKPEDFGKYKQ